MRSNWGFGQDSWEFLGQQGDQTSQSQENQPWIFIERTDAEAEAPILWPPDIKSQLIWKDPDARKDWSQEKGMTEEEMVGWHHWSVDMGNPDGEVGTILRHFLGLPTALSLVSQWHSLPRVEWTDSSHWEAPSPVQQGAWAGKSSGPGQGFSNSVVKEQ